MSTSATSKRLRVTLVYEYDVVPEDYPDGGVDPFAMARLDIESDPAIIVDTEWDIQRAVFR